MSFSLWSHFRTGCSCLVFSLYLRSQNKNIFNLYLTNYKYILRLKNKIVCLYWFDLKFPVQTIGKTHEFSNKISITYN